MIYLILCAGFKDNNPDQFEKRLKIGYTDNLENRLKAYQVANPGFILLDTREGDTRVESYLHKKFEKYRYKDSREWFYYNQEIVDNFHCEPEEIIDKDTLLKYIKKDLRSFISSISYLKNKYLNQILEELKSSEYFSEELYDEKSIVTGIIDNWQGGVDLLNRIIDEAVLINYQPINILNKNIHIIDISVNLPQILGRQKRLFANPWKNSGATFYYKVTCDYRKTPKEEFDIALKKKISRSENLLKAYQEVLDNGVKKDLAETYQYVARTKNYKDDYVAVNTHGGTCLKPVFNNLVLVSDIRAYDVQQTDYKDCFSVSSFTNPEFTETDIINSELEDFFGQYDYLTTAYDKLKLFCNFPFSSDEIYEISLNQVDEKIRSYLIGLGREKIKALGYHKTKIDRELGIKLFNPTDLGNFIRSEFKLGERLLLSEIKSRLKDLYSRLGYNATPKASSLLSYFETKEYSIYEKQADGTKKKIRGYELLSYKSQKSSSV